MGAVPPPIVRRRVEIHFDGAGDEGWMANRRFEAILGVLSLGFPSGEAFFVSSVRIHEAKIRDPEPLDRARRFIHQEAMHAKEHARFNRELLSRDRRGEISEILVRKFCAIVRRTTPKATQLAGTCAVEHVTAILAEWLLRRRESFVAASAPSLARLWLWHAAEELEHKAVCFDVYRCAVGRGPIAYLNRVAAMTVVLIGLLALFAISLPAAERRSRRERPAAEIAGGDGLPTGGFLSILFGTFSWRQYFDYYRPSFHPSQRDTYELLDARKRWSAADPEIRAEA